MTSHVLVIDRPRGAVSLVVRPCRAIDRLRARLRSPRLDRELAAGRAPEWSRAHAARAEQLVALPFRQRLADNWERVPLASARRSPGRRPGPLPRAGQVTAAEASIRLLVERLRAPLPVPARGVALANVLLTDGTGPLYSRLSAMALDRAVTEAVTLLDPAAPLMRHFT